MSNPADPRSPRPHGLTHLETSSIRRFVEAIARGPGPKLLPLVLARLARAAVRETPLDDEAGAADALGALLLKLTQLARRGALEAMLARSDVALVASLRRTLRNAARDLDPLLHERHALALHVRRALQEPPLEGAAVPLSLTDLHGRFVYGAVRAAVSAKQLRRARTAGAVTSALLQEFVARPVDERALEGCVAPERGELTGLEQARLEQLLGAVVTELGPSRTARLGRSLEGLSFDALAAETGVPRSTLHTQVRSDRARLLVYLRRAGGLDRPGAAWLVAAMCGQGGVLAA